MNKRILIVGTVPYNTSRPSRAFDAYFHGIDCRNMAQVFSNSSVPKKGHCDTLYQITDKMMLKRWLNRSYHVGHCYLYKDLKEMDAVILDESVKDSKIVNKLHSFGSRHSPLSHILRGILWKKKYWCTKEFNKWLEEFKPECVFISFSDEFFILRIAKYISEKFNIPIVFTISDDYFFNDIFSLSPIYYCYRWRYKKAVNNLLARSHYGVYICDKIKDKYNSYFDLDGETVYLTSNLRRKEFSAIPSTSPVIRYFGNVMLDRYKSLIDIGKALQKVNPSFYIEVFSGGVPTYVVEEFIKCSGIHFMGAIPYSEVCTKTEESDVLIVIEGFSDYNIRSTRYSLSTKAADALASGVNIFAYGSLECGLIDYLSKTNACTVCSEQEKLDLMIKEFLTNIEVQKRYYKRAKIVYEKNHVITTSTQTTRKMIDSAIVTWQNGKEKTHYEGMK